MGAPCLSSRPSQFSPKPPLHSQTYFLNFDSPSTVQQVLNAYKKWFLKEARAPSFMEEPACSPPNPAADLSDSLLSDADSDHHHHSLSTSLPASLSGIMGI